MDNSDIAVYRYLIPPEDSFWKWSKDGEIVVWAAFPAWRLTIAFRSEVAALIGHVSDQGAPPLDVLLLILAACRDHWNVADQQCGRHRLKLWMDGLPRINAWADATLRALDRVAALPPELRNDMAAKAELVSMVLETYPDRMPTTLAEEICRTLSQGPTDPPVAIPRVVVPMGRRLRELRGLVDGLERVDAESLRLRLQTGLEEVVQPAPEETVEIEAPQELSPRELLEALAHDEEFAGLARLARDLMAVVHIPRPVSDPEELSLGGVSDIANRGPLDRLLLSELAHDNDTLTMRVALGEAMYLRRERPPATPPRKLCVVIDSGLRMWGVPRVFATAVGLSLAAKARGDTSVSVYRAAARELAPVDFTQREGLVNHLAALEPELHPGEALKRLEQVCDGDDTDIVLITSHDGWSDPEFRRLLDEAQFDPIYATLVNRRGEFQLLQRTFRGDKTLREAVLDLRHISAESPRRPRVELIDKNVDPRLPAALRLKKFPLRLPYPSLSPRSVGTIIPEIGSTQVLAVTNDRRLLYWDNPALGAIQLAERLPGRRLLWVDRHGSTAVCVIGDYGMESLHLVHVDLESHDCEIQPLETDRRGGYAVCGHAGALFVIRKREVEVFDPLTGQRRASLALPHNVQWLRDRFFKTRAETNPRIWSGCSALSADGGGARLEPIPNHPNRPIASAFDCAPLGGPVIVTHAGHLYVSHERRLERLNHGLRAPVALCAASLDGKRIVLKGLSEQPSRQFAVEFGGSREEMVLPSHADPLRYVSGHLAQLPLRNRFQGIYALEFSLVLVTRKQQRLLLEWDIRQRRLKWTPLGAPVKPHRTFKPLATDANLGYRLKYAEWDDGSRVVLDSRGLLHLQSSDPKIPEVMIVLSDTDAAGWCADGRTWGLPYFTGAHSMHDAEEIFTKVIAPFVQRLQ